MSSRKPVLARPHAHGEAAEAGFTLIEVIVALALFAVIATLTMGFLIQAMQTAQENSDRILAANIARSQVEELRAMGTSQIDPGLTIGAPSGTDSEFVVRTTANWTAINQTTSSCANASAQSNYMRVHVEVTSPTLSTPEIVDALLQPDIETTESASVVVSVVDQEGDPVSDVQVVATDPANPGNNFIYTTGFDGCILVPNLTAPAVLTITVARQGFVPSEPNGAVQTVALEAKDVATPPAFEFAGASSVTFTAASGDYAVPSAVPVSWELNDTTGSTSVAALGDTISGMWPLPAGFTAWLGTCSDADPEEYSAPRTSYGLSPEATTRVVAASAPVLIKGVPQGETVNITYAGVDPACSAPSYETPNPTNAAGETGVGLPFGLWTFSAAGESKTLVSPLRPNADGSSPAPVTVDFGITNRLEAQREATAIADFIKAQATDAGIPPDYGDVPGPPPDTHHAAATYTSGSWTCTALPTKPVIPGSTLSADVGGGYEVTCALSAGGA